VVTVRHDGIRSDKPGTPGPASGLSLGRRSRPRLGLLVARLDDAYTSMLIRGIAAFSESVGSDLLLYVIPPGEVVVPGGDGYSIVEPALLDGIILTGGLAYQGEDAAKALEAFRDRCWAMSADALPLVGTSLCLEGVPSVVPSSYEGMREAVEHLIDVHGCRRLGFIGGPQHSSEARDRYRAYADALQACGLKVDPLLLAEGDFERAGGEAGMIKLLAAKPGLPGQLPLDALVCANDVMAIGAMNVLQERGIRVPGDLLVIGFDDIEDARRSTVPLTTVRQPVYDIGYRAATVLWRMIQGDHAGGPPHARGGKDLVIPTRMVVRRSCGCLPDPIKQAVIVPPPFAEAPVSRDMSEDPRAEIVAEMVNQARLSVRITASAAITGAGADRAEVGDVDAGALPRALVDAFWAELYASSAGSPADQSPGRDSFFVQTLAELMHPDGVEVERWDWHAMISILRRGIVPLLSDRRSLMQAEDLLQQARGFIGEARAQIEAHRHAAIEDRETRIWELTDSVASLEDLGAALARMEPTLSAVSVHAYCLATMVEAEDQVSPTERAPTLVRLERAYAYNPAEGDAPGVADPRLPGEGSIYPLVELLPEVTWQALASRPRMWIILPLSSEHQGFGISLFQGKFEYPATYVRLRQALVSVIIRSNLVHGQVEARREAELAMHRAEVALQDALSAQQRYVSQAWVDPSLEAAVARSRALHGYERTPTGEGRIEDAASQEAWLPAMTQAVTTGATIVERDEEGETLALPLLLYGQEVIGTLGFWRPLADAGIDGEGGAQQPWSDGQIRLVENVAHQMAQALETQRLFSDSHRRAARLAAAAEVSSAATSIVDLPQLLREAVTLIQDRFRLYYAGLFLVDAGRTWAVLVAGTGEAGAVMLERGHRLEVGGSSMIGRCVATGEARIESDTSSMDISSAGTGSEILWRRNPLLPETRSELALPLISRGTVIGAMTIQDDRPGAFTEGDITTLQTMADQLANAIENARLLEEMERTLREVQLATGRYTQETWRDFIRDRSGSVGYRYSLVDVEAVDDPRPEAIAAIEQDAVVLVHGTRAASEPQGEAPVTTGVGIPIRLRNQVLGALNLRFDGDTVAPEVLQMVEQVAERLAVSLESARLLEETRRAAERERLVGDVSRRIRQSLEVDEVLQSSVREIRDAMDLFRVSVRLAPRSDES
jgi:DNA-binding LacI/PurR family transcriptional regulator/GAF domain-containing protein